MNFYWSRLLPLTFFTIIPIFIWGIIDTSLLMRQGGSKLRRGIKLASKPLEPGIFNFLEALQEVAIEKRTLLFKEFTVGFILINGRERLVQIRKERWRTSWPYVGYVNLSQPIPTLEFRASLPMHLVLVPIIMTGVGIPFVALLMFFNYWQETRAIEDFIKRQKIALEK